MVWAVIAVVLVAVLTVGAYLAARACADAADEAWAGAVRCAELAWEAVGAVRTREAKIAATIEETRVRLQAALDRLDRESCRCDADGIGADGLWWPIEDEIGEAGA